MFSITCGFLAPRVVKVGLDVHGATRGVQSAMEGISMRYRACQMWMGEYPMAQNVTFEGISGLSLFGA